MEFFLFAALMGIDMLLFIYMASRYNYVDKTDDVGDGEKSAEEKSFAQKPVATYASDNGGYNDSAM